MKKTLVALAAIASVSAFAQTTVSITGNLDFAGARFSGNMYGSKGTTFTMLNGTASTSAINFTATEDIGGGTKITAFYGLDPRAFGNDNAASTMIVDSQATAPNGVTVTAFGRHEVYAQASGNFGSLKIGAPNAMSLDAHGVSSPLGTGVGSGWESTSNSLMKRSLNARYSRSIRYDSPVMSGFSGHLLFAPGGDQAAIDTGNSYAAMHFPNARRASEVAFKYANGPVNLMAVNVRGAAAANVYNYYSYTSASSAAVTTSAIGATNYNYVAANYNLGNTTVYAGMGSGGSINQVKTAATLASDKSSKYAVKHSMGPIDLTYSYTKVQTATLGTTGTINQTLTGFNGTYNLSKTAAAYLGYEKYDSGAASNATSATDGIRNITSLGLRKSF